MLCIAMMSTFKALAQISHRDLSDMETGSTCFVELPTSAAKSYGDSQGYNGVAT